MRLLARKLAFAIAGMVPAVVGLIASQPTAAESLYLASGASNTAFIDVGAEGRITVYFEGAGIEAGPVDQSEPLRLLEAISYRGGFKDFANKNKIQIVRDGKLLMTVKYKDMISDPKSESNPYLKDGDHIVVP